LVTCMPKPTRIIISHNPEFYRGRSVYKKAQEASDKVNKHPNNLYIAQIYSVSTAH